MTALSAIRASSVTIYLSSIPIISEQLNTALNITTEKVKSKLLSFNLRKLVRTWPTLTEITVPGHHFVPQESPHKIGRGISDWYSKPLITANFFTSLYISIKDRHLRFFYHFLFDTSFDTLNSLNL